MCLPGTWDFRVIIISKWPLMSSHLSISDFGLLTYQIKSQLSVRGTPMQPAGFSSKIFGHLRQWISSLDLQPQMPSRCLAVHGGLAVTFDDDLFRHARIEDSFTSGSALCNRKVQGNFRSMAAEKPRIQNLERWNTRSCV